MKLRPEKVTSAYGVMWMLSSVAVGLCRRSDVSSKFMPKNKNKTLQVPSSHLTEILTISLCVNVLALLLISTVIFIFAIAFCVSCCSFFVCVVSCWARSTIGLFSSA